MLQNDFSSYYPLTRLGDALEWDSDVSGQVSVTGGYEVLVAPVVGFNPVWFRPADALGTSLETWALDRVYRRYHSVEFDLYPDFPGTGSASDEGWFSLYLSPRGSLGSIPTTMEFPNPLLDLILLECRLVCYRDLSCTVELWVGDKVRDPSTWDKEVFLSLDPSTIPIPDFQAGTFRRFRVELGWDWHVLPGGYSTPGGSPENLRLGGDPRLYVRFMYQDDQGVWQNPNLAPSPLTYGNTITNGWTKVPSNWVRGALDPDGPDKVDWVDEYPNQEVYPYFVGERRGVDVEWYFDNLHFCSNRPEPASIMCNTLGYDTGGGQWAWLVPGTDYREPNHPNLTVDSATLICCDNPPCMTIPVTFDDWAKCFKEADPVTWNDQNLNYTYTDMWWRRLTWDPVTDTHPLGTCRLEVRVSSNESPTPKWQNYLITSPPFSIDDEVMFQATWREVSLINEQLRRMPDGGWNDAGGGFGENRSHGSFLSGMAWLLDHRRPEMSTADSTSLVDAMRHGVDWIELLAEDEYEYQQGSEYRRESHVDDLTHWVEDKTGTDPIPREGHIYRDRHTRPDAFDSQQDDWNDDKNDDSYMFMACSGLIDAANALLPFDATAADDAYTQANKTRTYLTTFPTRWEVSPRSRSSFWFQFHDYRLAINEPGYVDADQTRGRDALDADLVAKDPLDPQSEARDWVQADSTVTQSTRIPMEGLLEAIDRGLSPAPGGYPNTYAQARDAIVTKWYQGKHSSVSKNLLRIAKYWKKKKDVNGFKGNVKWVTGLLAMEALAMSRLAEQIGPGDPDQNLLKELATGNLGFLMGMHPGIRGRYANPPTDDEYRGAAFLSALPGLVAGQMWKEDNVTLWTWWQSVSVENVIHGEEFPKVVGSKAPNSPPWRYTPQNAPDGETYILNDGIFLMATEVLGRVLHPSLVAEAESMSSSGSFGSESNNATVGSAEYLNGGTSLFELNSNDQLTCDFFPPNPDVPQGQQYRHRVLLRIGNDSGGSVDMTVTVDPGPGQWTTTVTVPTTAHRHDYLIIDATAASRPLLDLGTHTLQLDFPNAGKLSLDCVVIKHISES